MAKLSWWKRRKMRKSSVPKEKREIFAQAEEDIKEVDRFTTPATKSTAAAAGDTARAVSGISDTEKRKREIAREARKRLAKLAMRG